MRNNATGRRVRSNVLTIPMNWRIAENNYHLAKPPEGMIGYENYLVAMYPVTDKELVEVVIVNARTNTEAIYEAFLTRNMPQDWFVADIERG